MPDQPPTERSAGTVQSITLIRLAAAIVALFGVIVILAWYARWTSILQLSPDTAAIKFNTGLCFILCSAGLASLTTRFDRLAPGFGGLAIVIGMVALLEYLTALPSGLDQIFIRDYIFSSTDFPGRMSQLSAGCFVSLGIGLVVASVKPDRRWRLPMVVALACVVAVIAAVALCGYMFGIEEAYGWGAYTRMAAHTACAFLVLSVAFLAWTMQGASQQRFELRSWLPIVATLTLMAMIAFVSSVSMRHLKNSVDWRMHTYIVLLSAQALQNDMIGMQLGLSDYAFTGNRVSLAPYWAGVKDAPLQVSELWDLTTDNKAQQPILDQLTVGVAGISAYAKRLIAVRDSQGAVAAIRLVSDGEGRLGMDRALGHMQSFIAAERLLLAKRTVLARDNIDNTAQFLVLTSILAAGLLGWAHIRNRIAIYRRRQVEGALQKLTALQKAILNAADYAIISRSVDGVVTTFNRTAERWLGYDAAEVVGIPAPSAWFDAGEVRSRGAVLSEELGFPVCGAFETLVAKARLGQRDESELTLIRKDGSRFPVGRSVTAQTDAAGLVVGYVSVITDLSLRKAQEAETSLSEERFRRAFDDAPIGMALVDPGGRWLRVNRAMCRMLDYSNAELLERDYQSITYREDREASEDLVRRTLSGSGAPCQMEKRYVRRDGALIFANVSVSLVRDARGAPLYLISQIEDISERKEGERIKREFIATVSHELRTPLTSIRGALGLINAGALGDLPEKAEAMVKIAYQNSERLVRIVNDILDVEKLEAGKLDVQLESVPLTAFLAQAAAVNQPYGAKHAVRFFIEAPLADACVLADPHRLMQVMSNLLSNAAKFSPPGAEVRIRAVKHHERVRIEVQDHGTGIPEAFRGRIFEKFAQADSSTSRNFAGTGLGLNITRELIKAMNGTIGFDTVTGEGTTFHFELPRAEEVLQLPHCVPAPAPCDNVVSYRPATPIAPVFTGIARVLHIEDDADLGRVIKAALEDRADLVTVGTLRAAEQLLREASFSLVILDIRLPDGDGLSLLEALTLGPAPVLILSATEVSREIRRRVAVALVKSRVSEAHIISTILSLLPQTVPQDAAAARPQSLS